MIGLANPGRALGVRSYFTSRLLLPSRQIDDASDQSDTSHSTNDADQDPNHGRAAEARRRGGGRGNDDGRRDGAGSDVVSGQGGAQGQTRGGEGCGGSGGSGGGGEGDCSLGDDRPSGDRQDPYGGSGDSGRRRHGALD